MLLNSLGMISRWARSKLQPLGKTAGALSAQEVALVEDPNVPDSSGTFGVLIDITNAASRLTAGNFVLNSPPTPPPYMTAAEEFDQARSQTAAILKRLKQSRTPEERLRIEKEIQNEADQLFSVGLMESAQTIDCGKGCCFCCYKKVDASASEIFYLVDHMRRNFTAGRMEHVKHRAKENTEKTRAMSADQQLKSNIPCPFLQDGACSVYAARPLMCRRDHSTNVAQCENSFNNPNDDSPVQKLLPVGVRISNLVLAAYTAYKMEGYDARPYDLSRGLIEAMENPARLRRWRDGKGAFSQAAVAKDWSDDILRQPFEMLKAAQNQR